MSVMMTSRYVSSRTYVWRQTKGNVVWCDLRMPRWGSTHWAVPDYIVVMDICKMPEIQFRGPCLQTTTGVDRLRLSLKQLPEFHSIPPWVSAWSCEQRSDWGGIAPIMWTVLLKSLNISSVTSVGPWSGVLVHNNMWDQRNQAVKTTTLEKLWYRTRKLARILQQGRPQDAWVTENTWAWKCPSHFALVTSTCWPARLSTAEPNLGIFSKSVWSESLPACTSGHGWVAWGKPLLNNHAMISISKYPVTCVVTNEVSPLTHASVPTSISSLTWTVPEKVTFQA